MSKAHFPVIGRLDHASRVQKGTITIDRATGLVEIRPYRRRRAYVVSLSTVAEIVVQRLVQIELAEKRRAKAAARKARKVKR